MFIQLTYSVPAPNEVILRFNWKQTLYTRKLAYCPVAHLISDMGVP